uniref:Membrane metallo-endopeptidase-like 1 n=1 Tax=Magallana gigas TaxID=29159 RepID=K1RH52_MAGGI
MESGEKGDSPREPWFRGRTRTERFLLVLALVLILLCAALICVVVYISVKLGSSDNFQAARVADGIDFSVDPCDNFYEYACGGWMKNHVIPSDRSFLASFSILRDTVQVKLKRELKQYLSLNILSYQFV